LIFPSMLPIESLFHNLIDSFKAFIYSLHNLSFTRCTTRKSINTNGNTEKIFPSVNCLDIFVGKLPRDFTDGNILSVYTEGITVKKNIKTKQKKMMTCHFYQRNYRRNKSVGKSVGKLWTLFIMSIIKGITDGIFRRYFPESSRTVHFPIARTKSPTDWKVISVIWWFSEKIQLI